MPNSEARAKTQTDNLGGAAEPCVIKLITMMPLGTGVRKKRGASSSADKGKKRFQGTVKPFEHKHLFEPSFFWAKTGKQRCPIKDTSVDIRR